MKQNTQNARSSISRDEPTLSEISNNNHRKTKITDAICNLLNYISLITSFVYNIYWFILLKKDLLILPQDYVIGISPSIGCEDLISSAGYVITWTVVSIIKSFTLLFLCRACFGNENDCNWFCLLVKALSSFIPSIIFVLRLGKYVENSYKVTNNYCETLRNDVKLFLEWELYYVIGILMCICFIPLGAFLMGMKEYVKSRKKSV